jgi:methylenetetrahydrofolate--tRNA-(uracil-5-)-methyltransferase
MLQLICPTNLTVTQRNKRMGSLVESRMMSHIQDAEITIIGGGLAGSEAAWQAAEQGAHVALYEMRPQGKTGAHRTDKLAELVCSNSLGSNLPDRATGQLLFELRRLNSLVIRIADETAVPAGSALAVDRELFAEKITEHILQHPRITVFREEVKSIPEGICVIASGPLTSPPLMSSISELVGANSLFFYDAIAPIIHRDSINMEIAFKGSRYGRGVDDEGDYINCPFTKEQYESFIAELLSAERIRLHDFERDILTGVKAGDGFFFERCLPVEILAGRDIQAMAYGPMRPVGLTDPRTGRWPYAVVQLRQDDIADTIYNMVGFQTNLTFPEQSRVLRLIPGLEKADFARYGQMHRNSFVCSPRFLSSALQHRADPRLFFAGQLIGVEGYAGNIASGLLAGLNAARFLRLDEPLVFPPNTMMGALFDYVSRANPDTFQPMKANFGILPNLELNKKMSKRQKHEILAAHTRQAFDSYLASLESQPENE